MAGNIDSVWDYSYCLINNYLVLRHAGMVNELPQHSKDSLRRGIDLIVYVSVACVAIVAIDLKRQ